MHATVLFRRGPLVGAGAFDTSLRACEDYDVYLRIARDHPVGCHDSLIAEYRQHATNMTRDAELMLRSAMAVLEQQRPHVRSNARRAKAYRAGLRFWRHYYGRMLIQDLQAAIGSRRWRHARRDLITLLRYHPLGVIEAAELGLARVSSVARRIIWAPPLMSGQARLPSQTSAPEGARR